MALASCGATPQGSVSHGGLCSHRHVDAPIAWAGQERPQGRLEASVIGHLACELYQALSGGRAALHEP